MCDIFSANDAAKKKAECPVDASTPPCATGKKDEKISRSLVQFRPKDDWKGEYGFDWLRIGGIAEKAGEVAYKGVIQAAQGAGSKAAAYTTLKSEYPSGGVVTEIKSPPDTLAEFFGTYISLFPQGTATPAGGSAPVFETELKVIVAVEETAPESISFEYDKTFLQLSKDTLSDTAVGAKRIASDGPVKITCKSELGADQVVKVWSTFEGEKKLVGVLNVLKNNAGEQKKLKFVFVKVVTDVDGTPRTGSVSDAEKTALRNSLAQALILCEIEDGPDLNLAADDNFRIRTVSGSKVYGKFIYRKQATDGLNRTDGLYEDYQEGADSSAMFTYLRDRYLAVEANKKFKDGKYFTIFAINEVPYDVTTFGQVQGIGIHNAALFAPVGGRKTTTLAHEVLHGLGLQHTHAGTDATNKFQFDDGTTDNIMSYSADRYSTWRWQWSIMKSSL